TAAGGGAGGGRKRYVGGLGIDGGGDGLGSPEKSPYPREGCRLPLAAPRLWGGISLAVSRTPGGSRPSASSGDASSRFHHPTHAGFVSSQDQEHSWCCRFHDLAVVRWHLPRCP